MYSRKISSIRSTYSKSTCDQQAAEQKVCLEYTTKYIIDNVATKLGVYNYKQKMFRIHKKNDLC